jgi:mRNA interferase MazF
MKLYHPGELLFMLFPFSDVSGGKRRPALVLLDTGDNDIVVARVTGQISRTEFDVVLTEWQQAGLLMPSVVRLHKVTTLEKHMVERRLGMLAAEDWARVRTIVQQLWASI